VGWKKEMRRRLTAYGDLARAFTLTGDEEAYFSAPASGPNLPAAVPRHFLSLIGPGPRDPLRSQCLPRRQEREVKPYESPDPLGEARYRPLPYLIHQYPGRVLIKTTPRCALYCRHCFRRSFAGLPGGEPSPQDLSEMAAYLARWREVREIILSGGDCLTLTDKKLFHLMDVLEPLRRAEDRRVFRLASRVPLTLPSRITGPLIRGLRRRRPLWLACQINHPRELAPAARRALAAFVEGGIPVFNQSVLLKGVNDSVEVLEALCGELVRCGIKPGYLFQGDLAPGTAHFRVNLDRGLALMEELKKRVSGPALPVYAVDLPGGGGKYILFPPVFLRDEPPAGEGCPGFRVFAGPGGEYRYPLEEE
jgi:lysine 2,3-aminomutase